MELFFISSWIGHVEFTWQRKSKFFIDKIIVDTCMSCVQGVHDQKIFDEEMMEDEDSEEDDEEEDDPHDEVEVEEEEEEGEAPAERRRGLLDSDSEGEDPEEVLGRRPQEKSTFEKQQEKV